MDKLFLQNVPGQNVQQDITVQKCPRHNIFRDKMKRQNVYDPLVMNKQCKFNLLFK